MAPCVFGTSQALMPSKSLWYLTRQRPLGIPEGLADEGRKPHKVAAAIEDWEEAVVRGHAQSGGWSLQLSHGTR